MASEASLAADPDLSSRLAGAAGPRAGDVAGAVIDVGADTEIRCGFVGRGSSDRAFEIGSVTKGLTGMLLADAINRGEIELQTTVSALLPAAADTGLGKVTFEQLSTHTSGLPRLPEGTAILWGALRFAFLGLDPYRGLGPDRVYRDALRQRLAQPGRRLYSNLGGALCGQLITLAAGSGDFARLLQERVLAPAGLTSSFVSTAAHAARPGHSPLGIRRQPWIMDGYAPAGGVVSTIADLARLIVGLLNESAPGCESLKQLAGADVGRGRRSGMFWIIEQTTMSGRRMIWHNGRTGGYSAFLALFPDHGQGLVVLTDVSDATRSQRLADVMRDALGGTG